MSQLILAILSTSAVSSLIAWFLTKRKQSAEIRNLKLGNAEQAIDINSKMLELLEQYQNDMVELRKEVKHLTETNERLQCEVKALRRMLNKNKADKLPNEVAIGK